MKKITFTLLFLLFAFLGFSQIRTLPNTLVIKLSDNAKGTNKSKGMIKNIVGKDFHSLLPMFPHKAISKNKSSLKNIYLLKTKGRKNTNIYLEKIKNHQNIAYVCPYYLPEVLGNESNDPLLNKQYYLPLIKAFEAHQISEGDTNICVGIVDTGVELNHEDLNENLKYNYDDPINGIDDDNDGFIDNYYGWDIADKDNNPNPTVSRHGTMVAGLACATGNNSKGIYGIGGKTKFLAVKVMDSLGNMSGAYEGIVYAADQGCQIINCSWGSPIKNPLCDDVVNYATNEKNCLIVAAAGNSRDDTPYYPAACEGVLNVTATNKDDLKWRGSTYGVEVNISAPGEGVYTTATNNGYRNSWGTSFASPIVAGCAALVKAKFPNFNPLQIAQQLRVSADVIDTLSGNKDFYKKLGTGRVNAFNALTKTDLIALRIKNLKHNKEINSGDTIKLSFILTNYLKAIDNATVSLKINPNYGKMLDSVFNTGKMETLKSLDTKNNPMRLVLNKDLPFDEYIELEFIFKSKKHTDYQAFKLLANPSFVNVKNKRLATTFTSNGTIGFANISKIMGKGLIFDKTNWLLAEAGIMIGNSDSNLVSALPGDFEFEIQQKVDTFRTTQRLNAYAQFAPHDTLQTRMPVSIKQTSKIYDKDELSQVVFHNYTVINNSERDMKNFAFSVFTNWDLDNEKFNRMVFHKDKNLFYAKTTNQTQLFAGVQLLGVDSCVPYAFDLVKNGNGGIDITQDFTNKDKWTAMTTIRSEDNNTQNKTNIASMLTAPKMLLKGKDSLTYRFAFVVASNYKEFINIADRVKKEYKVNIPVKSLSLNVSDTSVARGRSFVLTATVLPENASDKTIIWKSDNLDIATVGKNGRVAAIAVGKTKIIASTKGGEQRTICKLTVTTFDGADDKKGNQETSIYPTVTNNAFTIETNATNSLLTIYNISGKKVFEKHLHTKKEEINVSALQKGTYIVKIQIKGESFFRQLVVN